MKVYVHTVDVQYFWVSSWLISQWFLLAVYHGAWVSVIWHLATASNGKWCRLSWFPEIL